MKYGGGAGGLTVWDGLTAFPWKPEEDWEGGAGRDELVVGSRAIGEMHATRRDSAGLTEYVRPTATPAGGTRYVDCVRKGQTTAGWEDWEREPIGEIRRRAAEAREEALLDGRDGTG